MSDTNKIIVKLNPEKQASFFQDPTDESNLIKNNEIKEFNLTPIVQQCLNAQGLIRLHGDDKEVKEYFAKVGAADAEKAEAADKLSAKDAKVLDKVIAKNEKLTDELADAKAKIEDLETSNADVKELTDGKKKVEDDLIAANNTIADKDAEIKKLNADLKEAKKK